MKRAILSLLTLALLLLCACAAAEYTCGDFTYRLDEDGGAVLLKYKGPEGEVIIPNMLDGHPMTGVEGNPFYDASNHRNLDCTVTVARDHPCLATINGVLFCKTDRRLVYCRPSAEGAYEIPQGIRSIGDRAFYKCLSLTAVSIPDSVTDIGDYAFRGCHSLTAVSIPDSVIAIGDWAFAYCSSLTTISIPDSVTAIGDFAFCDCSSLAAVSIPDSVTAIGDYAFCDCSSLTAVSIPDSVTAIGDSAFCDCSSLTAVSIPDSVTAIGDSAFYGCSSLTAVSIPDSVTAIGLNPFVNCTGLTEITLSASHPVLAVIDGVLFRKEDKTIICYPTGRSADAYTIPQGIQSIGNSAFSGCSRLTAVSIPDSVTAIGDFAFRGCSSLTAVSIPDSVTAIGDAAFDGCSSLTDVSIPDSVTAIGNSVFYGCSSLTAVSIPDSVTAIGNRAFNRCPNLTLTVSHGSYAEQYCKKHRLPYAVDPAFSYNVLDDGTAEITGYFGGETGVVIPETISGHTVTGIVSGAFDGHRQITAIDVPDTVISLGAARYVPPMSVATATDMVVERVAVESPVDPPESLSSGPFRGCSADLVVTCGRGSVTDVWCVYNGVTCVYREQDFTEAPSDWLN